MSLRKLGMIMLTRPDGVAFPVRVSAIEMVQPHYPPDESGKVHSRIQVGGTTMFVMDRMTEIIERMEGTL